MCIISPLYPAKIFRSAEHAEPEYETKSEKTVFEKYEKKYVCPA